MTVVDILLTTGRFVIHWRKVKRIRWEDIFNAIACVFLIGFTTTYQLYVPIEYNAELYSLGLSNHPPTHRHVDRDLRYQIANVLLFWLVIYSVKASFLALYWNIFEFSTRFRVAWGSLAAFTFLSFGITLVSVIWHCGPPQDFANYGMYRE
jgi:hypothetical protein